jgi:hypothetical protein
MQYRTCKCGKCERWDTGEVVWPCQGCNECKTTYYQSGRKELQPHDYEIYYLGGSTPKPVLKCKRCHDIERIDQDLLKSFNGDQEKLNKFYEQLQKNLFDSIKQKCSEIMYADLQEEQ